jgi:enamine deaminase RidA (YjgF/YER057c/UK114 family)
LAEFLRERDLVVLHQKVLACNSWRDLIQEMQERFLSASEASEDGLAPPYTLVEGKPCIGGKLAGIQIVAAHIQSPSVTVEKLVRGSRPSGRVLRTPTHSRIYLAEVTGTLDGSRSPPEQTREMFLQAQERLVTRGFDYRDVVRTWIYFPDILDWYEDFNQARSTCYQEFGLMGEGARGPLPASTGIQARGKPGEAVCLDLVAFTVSGERDSQIFPAHNPRQNEAFDYGSSFSRAMVTALEGPRTCYVSGTASIDGSGKSIYLDDSQGQILETYLDVGALLGSVGLGLGDIRQATVYCKREEDFLTWKQIHRHLQLPDFPAIPVYGDVCRSNLLFEMEVLAVAGGQAEADVS